MNINDIANAAKDRKKLSKANAWHTYKKIVERLDQSNITDGNLYDAVTDLYKHFQPPVPAKPKTVEQWIGKAMAKQDARYYLKYVYSDGQYLVATDGHRLHALYGTDYPQGFYDATMQPINETCKYPDFKRVIPEGRKGDKLKHTFKPDLLSGEIKLSDNKEVTNIIDDIWVNKKYLVDALSYFDDSEQLEFYYNRSVDAVMIKYMDYIAVVMPIRTK